MGNLAKNAFEKGVNFTVWKRQGLAISLRLGKRVLACFTFVYYWLGICVTDWKQTFLAALLAWYFMSLII